MLLSPLGGIGRHKGLKIPRLKSRAGSSPAAGTKGLKVRSLRFAQFLHIEIICTRIKSVTGPNEYGKQHYQRPHTRC